MKTGLFALHFRVSFVGARLIESVFLQVRFRLSDFRHGASIEDVFFCLCFFPVSSPFYCSWHGGVEDM